MRTLYKYRTDSKYTEQIFTEKKVWFASPESLNDPFDCKITEFTASFKTSIEEAFIRPQLEGFIMTAANFFGDGSFFGVTASEKQALLNNIKAASTLKLKHQIADSFLRSRGAATFSKSSEFLESIDKLLSEIGVFCLSETCVNSPMWSYYADSHKGICIGFDIEDDKKLDNGTQCQPLIYSNVFPELDLAKGYQQENFFYIDKTGKTRVSPRLSFLDESFQAVMRMKSVDYAHEREWRILSESSGSYAYPGKLSRVIFGLNCSEEVRKKYTTLADQNIGKDVLKVSIIKQSSSHVLAAAEN